MSLRVERAGLQSSVQDLGRYGWQHVGIVPCGAMDAHALRLANVLVGNAYDAAALEITLRGPELLVERDALIALCGATFTGHVSSRTGERRPLPPNRPVFVRRGTRIVIGDALHGARAYLAVSGGFAVAPILGSRSTYLPAGFGGFEGRALRAGDRLLLVRDVEHIAAERLGRLSRQRGALREDKVMSTVPWCAPVRSLPDGDIAVAHVVDGRHRELFTNVAQRLFESVTFRLSPDSNRMGYRLTGATLDLKRKIDVLSEPTCLGTVQVPADGTPIVLMADHQTTGGYAKIAEVASADIARLAQLRPGAKLRFARCALAEAIALRDAARAEQLAIERAIAWEYRK